MLNVARSLLAQGKERAEIAEAVITAMTQDDLYVLSHPAWDSFVRQRTEHILGRHGPATLAFEEMEQRRAAGEQF